MLDHSRLWLSSVRFPGPFLHLIWPYFHSVGGPIANVRKMVVYGACRLRAGELAESAEDWSAPDLRGFGSGRNELEIVRYNR